MRQAKLYLSFRNVASRVAASKQMSHNNLYGYQPFSTLRYEERPYSFGYNLRRLPHHISAGTPRLFSDTSEEHEANELYSRFRQPKLGDDLWNRLWKETEHTRQIINQETLNLLTEEIERETVAQAEVVPELGPTGQYHYAFSDDVLKGSRTYRRWHVIHGTEETVMDINFHDFELVAVTLSVDETYVAYLVTTTKYPTKTQVWIRHIERKEAKLLTSGPIGNIEFGPKVDGNRHTIFYSTINALGRADSVHACTVDQSDMTLSPAKLMYHDANEAVMVDMQRTKGCQYVAIHATTKTSNEIRIVRCIKETPLLIRARQDGVQYHIDIGSKQDVFLLANDLHNITGVSGLGCELSAFETKLYKFPLIDSFGQKISGKDSGEYAVTDMELFYSFIAFYERSKVDGRQRIRIQRRKSKHSTVVPLSSYSGDCISLYPGGNMYYKATSLRFGIESPMGRGEMFEYDTLKRSLLPLSPPRGECAITEDECREKYTQKRVLVTSEDGITKVPLSLVYRNDVLPSRLQKNVHKKEKKDFCHFTKKRPTVLLGYGAYGEPMNLGFDPALKPLLNRGFVLAWAHTRGGGDCGRYWYHGGRLYNKQRAVEDYLACAKALVGPLQITDPLLLTAKAFSAGGVTVGAAINQIPSLFGSAVLTNAFLDVTSAMTDPTLPLTEHEWDEWGNPLMDDRAVNSISLYCPMSNLKNQHYPSTLLIGTLDDENVPFWHPVNFSIKLRKCTANKAEHSVLLHLEIHGGHHLHGRKLNVAALETAFILQKYEESMRSTAVE